MYLRIPQIRKASCQAAPVLAIQPPPLSASAPVSSAGVVIDAGSLELKAVERKVVRWRKGMGKVWGMDGYAIVCGFSVAVNAREGAGVRLSQRRSGLSRSSAAIVLLVFSIAVAAPRRHSPCDAHRPLRISGASWSAFESPAAVARVPCSPRSDVHALHRRRYPLCLHRRNPGIAWLSTMAPLNGFRGVDFGFRSCVIGDGV
ncbi:hypothetical protein R3P38DRAFT_3257696 [Favolaschia claudopus]|uniref:Uncharacterized protein n=1 Tax=Favolaschia claudopus TaxID=2862362 RepID=A0AAW0D3H6_9AGAR